MSVGWLSRRLTDTNRVNASNLCCSQVVRWWRIVSQWAGDKAAGPWRDCPCWSDVLDLQTNWGEVSGFMQSPGKILLQEYEREVADPGQHSVSKSEFPWRGSIWNQFSSLLNLLTYLLDTLEEDNHGTVIFGLDRPEVMNAIYKNLVTSLTEALDAVKFDKKTCKCSYRGAMLKVHTWRGKSCFILKGTKNKIDGI